MTTNQLTETKHTPGPQEHIYCLRQWALHHHKAGRTDTSNALGAAANCLEALHAENGRRGEALEFVAAHLSNRSPSGRIARQALRSAIGNDSAPAGIED